MHWKKLFDFAKDLETLLSSIYEETFFPDQVNPASL